MAFLRWRGENSDSDFDVNDAKEAREAKPQDVRAKFWPPGSKAPGKAAGKGVGKVVGKRAAGKGVGKVVGEAPGEHQTKEAKELAKLPGKQQAKELAKLRGRQRATLSHQMPHLQQPHRKQVQWTAQALDRRMQVERGQENDATCPPVCCLCVALWL